MAVSLQEKYFFTKVLIWNDFQTKFINCYEFFMCFGFQFLLQKNGVKIFLSLFQI